ncbi:MAG: T9SS type A sorting domain-containing protein [Bacteroidota bacterium]|nr:T9SS type A sorting domain-containing protein [Bacteroidota bacterium]
MKKLYTLAAATMLCSALFAQSSFSDDFEAYAVGAYLGPQPQWTTWSGASSTTEDTQVNNVMNNTPAGSNSVKYVSTVAGGGPQDQVLPFGGQYNTGNFVYQMSVFIETGKGAYFNFQGSTTIGSLYAMECHMNQLGEMYLTNTNGMLAQTTCPLNQWFDLKFDIQLNTNIWDVYINNVLVASFSNTVNQIASIDIYPANLAAYNGNGQSSFYVDDVSYTHTPYTLPTLNAAVTAVGALNPATQAPASFNGIVGQTKSFAATVRNLGVNAITSFTISYNYNSGTITQNVSAVNIASLASYQVNFSTPATLASGNLLLSVTVSNVNGAGADGDASDDIGSQNVNISVVPAPGKIVVGEEATGTWCQWCPRGAVFMDYMENSYAGFWAGIAVHNGDPMTVATYDAGMGALVAGYPSQLVDRGTAIDPSQVEGDFLSRVVVPGVATMVNGAQYNSSTGQLDVSITYNFTGSATSAYKVACVLTEDDVTGTTGYSQSNAYGNNANGPMGGFELFGTTVSYTIMSYDHVARAISPSFAGGAGFPSTVSSGYSQTFNYTFNVPAAWDITQMHIVGMLIEPNGIINNGSTTTISEAVANGYVTGTNTAELPGFEVKLFPNPTNADAQLTVNLSAPQNVIVTITDVTGKVVGTHNYGELNGNLILPIETAALAKGIYMVEIRAGESITTKKLIVQ